MHDTSFLVLEWFHKHCDFSSHRDHRYFSVPPSECISQWFQCQSTSKIGLLAFWDTYCKVQIMHIVKHTLLCCVLASVSSEKLSSETTWTVSKVNTCTETTHRAVLQCMKCSSILTYFFLIHSCPTLKMSQKCYLDPRIALAMSAWKSSGILK